MKILQLTLINFARVFSGLGKTKLELDFTNINNKINLFVGSNGTGKTSIMSCLHPFAYNSAIGDSTSNSDLIIEGKDGKKVIVIQDDNDIYEIVHVYNRKKDGSINLKSFVKLNNEELNSSGTVTTFKTIIQEKLGIDQTYLTLLSIGNTVKGFVDFTASDRKNYASKIFTELEIYAKHYKNLTAKDRSMKVLLNSVVSKLSKYSGMNKLELRDRMNQIDKLLEDLNSKKTQYSQNIGGINNQLMTYQNTIQSYQELQSELTQLSNQCSSLSRKITDNKPIDELQRRIDTLKGIIQKKEVEASGLKEKVTSRLDIKTMKLNSLTSVNLSLSKMTNNGGLSELIELKNKIESELDSIQSQYDISMKYPLSKDEMIKAVIYLDELKNICDNFLTDVNDKNLIIKLFDQYKKNPNIVNELTSKYQYAVEDVKQFSAIMNNRVDIRIPTITHECSDEHCPYKKFYEDYVYMVEHSQDANTVKMAELNKRVGVLSDMLTIVSILQRCYDHLNKYSSILSKVSVIFNKDSFVNQYMADRTVYLQDKATIIIDTMENIEDYHKLKEELKSTEEKIMTLTTNKELYDSLKANEESLEKEISELDHECELLKSEYHKLQLSIQSDNEMLRRMMNNFEFMLQLDDVNKNIASVKGQLASMDEMMVSINLLKDKLQGYQNEIHSITKQIYDLTNERNEINVTLSNIESLQMEEIEIRNKYDLISNVRSALSPTTGIPLDFIEYYIKEEIIGRINELLDSVYHGRLRLLKDEVVIDDSSFTIPYIKNNTTIVKDISKASDGERAILSIAFSLVLIQLSSNKYNIMLLDEIDTSLDTASRGKFIDLLESYMYTIKAEQLFLISHNNMFDSYPVCVLLTSEYQGLNYSEATMYKLCN